MHCSPSSRACDADAVDCPASIYELRAMTPLWHCSAQHVPGCLEHSSQMALSMVVLSKGSIAAPCSPDTFGLAIPPSPVISTLELMPLIGGMPRGCSMKSSPVTSPDKAQRGGAINHHADGDEKWRSNIRVRESLARVKACPCLTHCTKGKSISASGEIMS